ANDSSYDSRNNVENVFVQAPGVGTWTVEVTGATIRSARQQFALVVSGALEEVTPPVVSDESTFPGAPAGSKFGWNVTVASVDGDAYADIIVGAPGASGGNGSVYLFFGAADADASGLNVSQAGAILHGTAGENFGWDLDASSDWDGDGVRDLLVGAPAGGKAYLFLGMASWTGRTANVTFTGSSGDRFGESVRLAAGLDATSGAEAVIGAPRASSLAGRAYVFSGGAATGTLGTGDADATILGGGSGDLLGSALSSGDLNGDGDGDLAVGAPGTSKAYVLLGGIAASSLAVDVSFAGLPDTRFGHSVSLEGDVNGDGFDDLLVGAPLANGTAGASYAFFGSPAPDDNQVKRYYFFDDMESGPTLWTEMSAGSNASTPWNITSSAYFGDGDSGHAWEDSPGSYANLVDYSIRTATPVNLTGASDPVLSFVYLSNVEGYGQNYDGFRVEYSTNGGSSWTQVDASNTQGLYDTTVWDTGNPNQKSALAGSYAFTFDRPVWRLVVFNVSSLAGQPSVAFRFRFASDFTLTEDGVYIDNVAVRERNPSSPNFTIYGVAHGDLFGMSVTAFGSASGTAGISDFAVGAPYADKGLTPDAGAAFVFTGSSSLGGTTTAASAAAVSRGNSASSGAGWSVSGLEGFNGSSAVRIFVGAPLGGANQGGALVGDVTEAIPELSDAAAVSLAVALLFFVRRKRGRRPDDL
ncbi:MAG TPA: hypothetical protein VGB42_04145, partial [Candidatus Thermoplasmatota archaeon]